MFPESRKLANCVEYVLHPCENAWCAAPACCAATHASSHPSQRSTRLPWAWWCTSCAPCSTLCRSGSEKRTQQTRLCLRLTFSRSVSTSVPAWAQTLPSNCCWYGYCCLSVFHPLTPLPSPPPPPPHTHVYACTHTHTCLLLFDL